MSHTSSAPSSQSTDSAEAPRTSRAGARPASAASDTALVAVFAALIAASAAVPAVSVGAVGVPITIQTLVIALTGMCLGPVRGFAATALYVVLGLIGLPIFANFRGGLGVLAGPSAGYIIAFAIFALLCGVVARLALRRLRGWKLWLALFIGGLIASAASIHLFGVIGISLNAGLPVPAAIAADAIYIPGDIIKNALAAALAVTVHRAFPQLLTRRVLRAR